MYTNCKYTRYVHTYVANYHIIYTRGRTTYLSSSGKLGSSELRCKAASIVATTENHSGVTEGVSTSYVYIQLQV